MAQVSNEDFYAQYDADVDAAMGGSGGGSWYSADSLKGWLQLGTSTYKDVSGQRSQAPSPARPAPAAKPFNWKPFAIGGGIFLAVVIVLGVVFKSRK